MVFAIVFFLNAAANFALGLALSALLGPAEFGRYATVALAAATMATAIFDWLRLSSVRFSGGYDERARVAASLDAGYLAMIGLAVLAVLAAAFGGFDFGLGATLVALTPFLAVANARSDYAGAQMRARDQARAFAIMNLMRQALVFTIVLAVAAHTRRAEAVAAALAITTLTPIVALGAAMRTPGARLALADRATLRRFVVYAKPIVVSTVIYQLIGLINRQIALGAFGAAATGKLALATDLGFRLFLAINVLPETLLFQYALQRDRDEGRAAGEAQIAVNHVLVFAALAPLTAGYMAMAPTFEALIVPQAFHGDYARLSLSLAPGFLAFCALYAMANPVFQLEKRTWPLTLAACAALATDLVLTRLPAFSEDIEGLARAHAASLVVGFAIAAGAALRRRAMRPAWRDIAAIALASLAMAAAVQPLNAIHPPALAAALGVLIGLAVVGGTILAFDVAGLRAATSRGLARWRVSGATPRPSA